MDKNKNAHNCFISLIKSWEYLIAIQSHVLEEYGKFKKIKKQFSIEHLLTRKPKGKKKSNKDDLIFWVLSRVQVKGLYSSLENLLS